MAGDFYARKVSCKLIKVLLLFLFADIKNVVTQQKVASNNSGPWCFNQVPYNQASRDAKRKPGSGGTRTHASEETGA